jgi:hypothetical protein
MQLDKSSNTKPTTLEFSEIFKINEIFVKMHDH